MSCMYNSTIPWWMMAQGPTSQVRGNDPDWVRAFEIYEKLKRREIKKQLKEEEKKKKEKPPKKFRDFTFLEVFGMLTVGSFLFGPWIAHLQLAYLESILH